MPNVFPLLSALFLLICAVLYFLPRWRVLNFVEYGTLDERVALNRYASLRFLLPATVCGACAVIAESNERLTLPLVFVVMPSILATVIWINAGVSKIKSSS